MKDQLVIFETALLAKEKGFNEMCKNSYVPSGYLNSEEDCGEFFSNGPLYTVAPTQSLLQKWLRDIHNIEISIEPVWENNLREKTVYIPWVSYSKEEEDQGLRNEFPIYFNTYEEALENALVESLPLIKQ